MKLNKWRPKVKQEFRAYLRVSHKEHFSSPFVCTDLNLRAPKSYDLVFTDDFILSSRDFYFVPI